MGTKKRAYGADVAILAGRYVDDAEPVAYHRLLVSSIALSAEQPLGYDPMIGGGTNEAQDPYYDAVSDSGDVVIPLDARGTGFWLSAVFGPPQTSGAKAVGKIAFAGQPAAGSTIALGGVAWTFVAGAAGASETSIGADLAATLAALASDLNASINATLSACTYTATATELLIEHDAPGIGGNAFAMAASAGSKGVPDAATLRGGGWRHVFTSGADDVPEHLIEIGHVKLATPRYYRHERVKAGGLKIQLGQGGRAKATVPLIAVGETEAAATISGAPTGWAFTGFSNSGGFVRRGGTRLGDLVGGQLDYSNGLEAVRTIREDQKIEGADTGEHSAKGSVTVRFGGAAGDAMLALAKQQAPTDLVYGFSHPAGWSMTMELSRVFLPLPKREVRGPGGIEAEFPWQASGASGALLTVTLVNDVETYA